MPDALYITAWHDPPRGFQPLYRRGRAMKPFGAPTAYYHAPVRHGRVLGDLVALVGPARAFQGVGVYELCCQQTCCQPFERRGFLLDQFGNALHGRTLAEMFRGRRETARPVADQAYEEVVKQAARDLVQAKWLAWRRLPESSKDWRQRYLRLKALYECKLNDRCRWPEGMCRCSSLADPKVAAKAFREENRCRDELIRNASPGRIRFLVSEYPGDAGGKPLKNAKFCKWAVAQLEEKTGGR